MSKMLSKLWTLSPVKTSFTTASVPSCRDKTSQSSDTEQTYRIGSSVAECCNFSGARPYALMNAQLQAAILNHVNTVVSVTWSEKRLSLVQLDQHHVTAQLQEKRLFKVSQHSENPHTSLTTRCRSQNGSNLNSRCSLCHTYLTFFSMYNTSEGRWEFCTSNSVRSASRRQGGGSLGCRVGGSRRIRRIL